MTPPLRYPPTMGMNPRRTPLPNPPLAPTAVQVHSEYGSDPSPQRRALAANSFRLLQHQGYIPREARLDSNAPRGGGTYRDRFESLIGDRNRDGHLDLDLAQLRDSGLVRPGTTVQQLDRAIAADVRQPMLTDEFLREQGGPDHRLTGQDRADQSASRGLTLRNPNEWGVRQYASAAEVRAAATDGGQAESIANGAILAAQVMEGRGDGARARDLLARTGEGLQDAHQFGAARSVLRELTRDPHRTQELDLVEPTGDRSRPIQPITNSLGNRTEINTYNFHSTYGHMAEARLAQMAQVDRMEAALGRRVDPTNVEDARAYLESYARTHTREESRTEYGNYLTNFYEHAGQGVTWDAATPVADRPGRMTEYLREQPVDAQGRRLIDCEGFIYLNHRLLPGMGYEVFHGGDPGHVISFAVDRRANTGFVISNNDVSESRSVLETAHAAQRRLPDGRFDRRLERVDAQGTLPLE